MLLANIYRNAKNDVNDKKGHDTSTREDHCFDLK